MHINKSTFKRKVKSYDYNTQNKSIERKSRYLNFKRELLPSVGEYFGQQNIKLTGGSEWKSAICPFHNDNRPSLRVRLDSGGFICMACGVHGGDILEFHRKLNGLSFEKAARDLGAWEDYK
ncbi:CHC2 zinc finger domain-containing protein [Legionella pneumophila serogroup 1]